MVITSPWPSLRPYPSVPAWELMAGVARQHPDQPALIEANGPITTYAEVLVVSQKAARFLQREAGVAKGETVAIVAEAARETVALMHGALMAGAKLTTFSEVMSKEEIEARLADSEAAVAFAPAPLRSSVSRLLADGRLPQLRCVYATEGFWEVARAQPGHPDAVAIDPDRDVGILAYTSGTGGLPKGAMLTHANLNASALQLAATGLGGPDGVVLSLRVFWSTTRRLLATGATCLVEPTWDPDEILFLIERHRASQLLARPQQLEMLAAQQRRSSRDLSSLRYVESSAAPLPDHIASAAAKAFPCGVRQGYHLTEAGGSANRTLADAGWQTVGHPVPDTEERIVGVETGEDLPPGAEGELLIRGPQVMMGYWRQPSATAEAFAPGGWLRTGDLACQDPGGNVLIMDRIKELIKVYGLPVVPAQLEAILVSHPSVREAAVVPVPDLVSGEAPKAFVVLEPGRTATGAELLALVAERLVRRKRLHEVEFIESLPRNSSGKVLRRVLVERERARRRGYRWAVLQLVRRIRDMLGEMLRRGSSGYLSLS